MSDRQQTPDWTKRKWCRGIDRLVHATGYSLAGLWAGWRGPAFRFKALIGAPLMGEQWHALAKQAKDLGSAAVFLSLLLCLGIWGSALWTR